MKAIKRHTALCKNYDDKINAAAMLRYADWNSSTALQQVNRIPIDLDSIKRIAQRVRIEVNTR